MLSKEKKKIIKLMAQVTLMTHRAHRYRISFKQMANFTSYLDDLVEEMASDFNINLEDIATAVDELL